MTQPTAYYNEIDPAAAHILRAMIDADVIAPGDVDTRSIKDVRPDDLSGYTQCHFFAGGGLWSVAARLAGWPDDRPLWTGSCPCQPFSAAGKGLGTDDPRHLWPDFHRLIRARRPAVIMGEQVAGKAGYGWFDGVRADLAREDYAGRAVDFPACSVDAPHQRNRLYWIAVAESERSGCERRDSEGRRPSAVDASGSRHGVDVGDDFGRGCARPRVPDERRQEIPVASRPDGRASVRPDCHNGTYWSDADWIACHDGKARRAQSGIRFLVDGLPGRVDLWRVGGNAIVPEAAREVIAALLDAEADERLRLTGVFA